MIRQSNSDNCFIPAPKRRKYRHFEVKPFPTDCTLTGIFNGLNVEIFDEKSIKTLIQCGYYGNNSLNYRQKPTFSSNVNGNIPIVSKNDHQRKLEWKEKFEIPENDQQLISVDDVVLVDPFFLRQSHVLIPEEAMFLKKELNCLEVKDLDDNILSTEDLWTEFCDLKYNFLECYVGYLYLKSKNWVIKSGIKFGGHFLLYKQGPQFYHASYIVKIVTDNRSCYEHQANERIAEITKKSMLYLEIYPPEHVDSSEYMQHLDKFKVKEVVLRRYDVKEKFMS